MSLTGEGPRTDLHMLLLFGSREATVDEVRALLDVTGFEFARVLPTESPGGPSAIEALPIGRPRGPA